MHYIKSGLERFSLPILVFLFCHTGVSAQANRTQLPGFFTNKTFFEINAGYIDYKFSNLQLENGFKAESVNIRHPSVRLVLYGYQPNKKLSVQATYLRPVYWLQYKNINGDQARHSVVMNLTGLTLRSSLFKIKKIILCGEVGITHVSRTGFSINNIPAVKNASFMTFLAAVGVNYRMSDKFNLITFGGWSPNNAKQKQPATFFITSGVRYNIQRYSEEKVKANANSGYIFPANLFQIGITSNTLGYGVNNFVSNKTFPIFWGGDVQVKKGFSLYYMRNIFHSRKLFSIDLGVSSSIWTSNIQSSHFYTFSVFPVFRFTVIHSKFTDLYFNYSVAGPSYISQTNIDHTATGKHFTFQDLMGIGMYAGRSRHFNLELRVGHYSNGDLFPENNGVKVPLSLNTGFAF